MIVLGPPDEIEMSVLRLAPALSTAATQPAAGSSTPSSTITFGTARLRRGLILLPVVVPDAGTLTVTGGATVRRTKVVAVGPGTLNLRVALTKATLRRAGRHSMSLRLRVTFTPIGGTAATKSVEVAVGRSPSRR